MLGEIYRIKRLNGSVNEDHIRKRDAASEVYQFYRIHKISLSDQLRKEELQGIINQGIQQFIVSLTGSKSPVIFRLQSKQSDRTIGLYLGMKKSSGLAIPKRFGSYFQSVKFTEADEIENEQVYQCQSIITGIPSSNETEHFSYIEPVVKIMRNQDIRLEIISKPIHSSSLFHQLNVITEKRSKNSSRLHKSQTDGNTESDSQASVLGSTRTDGTNSGGSLFVVNSGSTISEGSTSSDTYTKGTTLTHTTNTEYDDYEAVALDEVLELYMNRMQRALSSGLWQTSVSLYANHTDVLAEVSDIYKSVYGIDATEPFQVFTLQHVYPYAGWQDTARNMQQLDIFDEATREFSFLTGEELSYLFDIPKEEYNGYEIAQEPRFGQNQLPVQGISLGKIYDGEELTSIDFQLDPEQLVKHLMVAGITGSGKTNTIFNLLQHVHVPFLIIEPSKKEYRGLKQHFPDIRVYTLGSENISPLRLNPFYFPGQVNIQQHIDNLKVIFNASFSMYASMPNILEQCIMNVYVKKGWSLTTSRNIYQQEGNHYLKYFPTIEDLYYEIDDYTKNIGYAQEQTQNIRAALLTRIKSLMTGGKGLMLNTVETISIEELMRYPVVLELDAFADDDEKSLVIGLISVFIYEYLKSVEVDFSGRLKHLLVFEEAHRIFANVSANGSQEDVNIRGKAVESLSHMLSEVRAYGEGMIIVDQVPTKLAPDVLKNTNAKIIHRIVSKDDIEYVANSLGLKEDKLPFISKLKNGSALVYTDGMNSPVHLQIRHGKYNTRYQTDSEIAAYSKSYNYLYGQKIHMNPLTEIIMNNLDEYLRIYEEIDHFYDDSLVKPLSHLQERYEAVKNNLSRYAAEYGFDMDVNVEEFVISFMREAFMNKVKTDLTIKKKINKQIFLERYFEAIHHLVYKDYESNKKEYVLLELNQRKWRGDING